MASRRPPAAPKDAAFALRLDDILRERGWSQNELGARSGLGSGPISKLRQRGPSDATVVTLFRVADAAGVELRWLALGEGPRRRGDLPNEARGRRRLAADLAEEAGIPRRVINLVLSRPLCADDNRHPTLYWIDQMRAMLVGPIANDDASGEIPATRPPGQPTGRGRKP